RPTSREHEPGRRRGSAAQDVTPYPGGSRTGGTLLAQNGDSRAVTMCRRLRLSALTLIVAVIGAGCESARLPFSAGLGANPALPLPSPPPTPPCPSAPARGGRAGAPPTAPPGTTAGPFAAGFEHPRWLSAPPNGDVLVAESAAPPQPEEYKGLKGV